MPASVTVEQETVVKLFCEAEASGDDSVSSYAWFETPTGQLKDIVAIGSYGGQPEENPVLVCDTSTPGTRYYVCYVMTKLGGVAYSSVIPVTVTEKTVVTQPQSEGSDVTDPQTTSLTVHRNRRQHCRQAVKHLPQAPTAKHLPQAPAVKHHP